MLYTHSPQARALAFKQEAASKMDETAGNLTEVEGTLKQVCCRGNSMLGISTCANLGHMMSVWQRWACVVARHASAALSVMCVYAMTLRLLLTAPSPL